MRIEVPPGLLTHGTAGRGQRRATLEAVVQGERGAAGRQGCVDPDLDSGPNVRSFRRPPGNFDRPGDFDREFAGANAILSMHPDPLLVLDRRRRIVRGNDAARDLFGDDFLRRDLSAALRDPAVLDAADAVLAGNDCRVVDFTLANRADRHYRARIAPIENYPEDCGAALLTVTDFTEAKRAERLRADFVANASHELRTPLAILLGFLETLTGSAADDPDAQRRFLPIMQQQASRMARLVDDLLALSRIELVEHAPPAARLQLPSILAVVAQALKLRAAGRRMRIELDLPEILPEVSGDADELGQLFQNLIDNSIKYAAADTTIVVAARPSRKLNPGVAVSIRDRGEGIAEQHLNRLTERFYRVDTARSRAVGGTGLGLAIVKHIVNRHRGILDIESRVGVGSVFTVHLGAASPVTPAANGRWASSHVEQPSLVQVDASPAAGPRTE